MTIAAQIIVAAFGFVVTVFSLWGMVATAGLLAIVRGVIEKTWGLPVAVLVRVILGVALLLAAPVSKFPMIFSWLGFLTLIAAAALPIIGRGRMIALLGWFQDRPGFVIRLWLVFGVLFGVFMLYGVAIP